MSEAQAEAQTGSLARLEALLGQDVFFVPCEWGTKKPLVTYVERPFDSTKTEAYRALFAVQEVNVAVYLGKASGGLCAIDFDRDEDLIAFLATNPRLADTTQSRGSRGGMLWLRLKGEFPESCTPSGKHFEWRGDKRLSTIYGRHPAGMDYKLLRDSPPLVIQFSEIVWPEGWELPWVQGGDARLKELYGEPFYLTDKGAVSGINEPYWAGMHALENEVLYEPDEKTFYSYSDETGLHEVESSDAIRHKISGRMLEASRQANVFDLQKRRTATTLNNVVAHLRGIAERRGAFTGARRVIHLANGVIVFNGCEAELRPFSPEFRSRNRSAIRATCPQKKRRHPIFLF
jgi:bifunctional DNA primase/polymerase-like protein